MSEWVGFLGLGLCAGVASGMLGIGGAVLLVPGLMFLFGFSQARAQGTSLAAMIPPIGILAAIQYYRNGFVDLRAAGAIALAFVFGAFGGASLVPHVPQIWLKRMFGALLLYIAFRMFKSN